MGWDSSGSIEYIHVPTQITNGDISNGDISIISIIIIIIEVLF